MHNNSALNDGAAEASGKPHRGADALHSYRTAVVVVREQGVVHVSIQQHDAIQVHSHRQHEAQHVNL